MMRLARDPMRRLASPWVHRAANFVEQTRRARETMIAFDAYAREIGCIVIQDETIANDEQARKLARWWREHTAIRPEGNGNA